MAPVAWRPGPSFIYNNAMFLFWYFISSVVFGAVLFFPVRKFIMALGINRHQRKVQREITPEERAALKNKVNVIAAVIAFTFAFIYNRYVMMKFFGGQGG